MKSTLPLNKFLAAASALIVSATVTFADSISPTSYSDTLAEGESVTIRKTVTVSAGVPTSSKVDVFFLADTTGSMGSYINTVKASANSILGSAAGLGDVAFGVGNYNDFSDEPVRLAYELGTNITTSQATASAAINAWTIYYGGDYPEANLYALTQVANTTSWRAGSERMVVIFGDAPGHDPSGGATLASTIAALNAQNVSVLAINLYGLNDGGQAAAYTSQTGGALYNGINNASIVSTISNAITTSVSTYSSVGLDISEAPTGVTVTYSPGAHVGAYDRSIERTFDFDVTFTGDTAGVYDFSIYGTVDGGRVATETDHIVVTAAGVPDTASTFMLFGAALAVMGLARRKLLR